MTCNAELNREARTRSQRNCDRGASLQRVFRLARVMEAGMEQLQTGVYRIRPADVLALRTALVQAALIISRDERTSA